MSEQPGAPEQAAPLWAESSPAAAPRRARRKLRARLSPLTVIGELLCVGGLAIVGFFGWQYLQTEVVAPGKQQQLSSQDSARWQASAGEQPEQWDGEVPVVPHVQPAEVFGVLYVPAFGAEYANRMAETTDWWTVLNLDEKGIGHYESTQMPGEPGNFAVAAHRSGPVITSFREIMNLRVGDPLYVETEQGWYTYRFRSIEYVLPTEVDVINPFPRLEGEPGKDQIMTLTTCHPKEAGSDERAIAYAVFEGFQPRSAGPPESLVKVNPNVGKAST